MEKLLVEQRLLEQQKVIERKEAIQAMHKDMKQKTCAPQLNRGTLAHDQPPLRWFGVLTRAGADPHPRRQLEKERSLAKIRQEYETRLKSEVRSTPNPTQP